MFILNLNEDIVMFIFIALNFEYFDSLIIIHFMHKNISY